MRHAKKYAVESADDDDRCDDRHGLDVKGSASDDRVLLLYAPSPASSDDEETRSMKYAIRALSEGMPDLLSTLAESPRKKRKKRKNRRVETLAWSSVGIRQRRALREAAKKCGFGYARLSAGGCVVWRPRTKSPIVCEKLRAVSDADVAKSIASLSEDFLRAFRAALLAVPFPAVDQLSTGTFGPLPPTECRLAAWDLNQDPKLEFSYRLRQLEARFGSRRHVAAVHPRAPKRKRWVDPALFPGRLVVDADKNALRSLVAACRPTDVVVCTRNLRLAADVAALCDRCVRVEWGTNKNPTPMRASPLTP